MAYDSSNYQTISQEQVVYQEKIVYQMVEKPPILILGIDEKLFFGIFIGIVVAMVIGYVGVRGCK